MSTHDDWAARLDPEAADAPPTDAELGAPVAADLDRIAATLRDPSLWDEPPSSLRDRIMAQATSEAAMGTPISALPDPIDAEPAPVEPPDVERPESGPAGANVIDPLGPATAPTPAVTRARARWYGPAMAALAGAAVAAAIILAIPLLGGSDGTVTTFEVAGTDLAPEAQASVDVEPLGPGVAITLHITGLPPAGEGEYYAGWLTGPDGQVGIGSFHWREGGVPIELWSGVDVERYPILGITIQREGEPTVSNGELVLRGSLVDEGG